VALGIEGDPILHFGGELESIRQPVKLDEVIHEILSNRKSKVEPETEVGPELNLNYLLILIPMAIGLSWSGASPFLLFAVTALSIRPVSRVVGSSTETLARYVEPTLGGLLNAPI
jgi:hypothetical protein